MMGPIMVVELTPTNLAALLGRASSRRREVTVRQSRARTRT
jgi:hypothetical protein